MKKSVRIKLIVALILTTLFAVCMLTACNTGGGGTTTSMVKVTFLNYDGEQLYVAEVKSGSVPEYRGATPKRESTESVEYLFEGWIYNGVLHTNLPSVSRDTVFTANYSESARKYVVTFVVNGQNIEKSFAYGTIPSYDGQTTFEIDGVTYNLTGWDKDFEVVKGEATYVAILTAEEQPLNTFTVTFEVDGEALVESVKENEMPKFYGQPYRKERVDCYFEFVGWSDGENTYTSDNLPVATKDVTYVAVFDAIYKTFTVQFNNNGSLIWQTTVRYGEVPVYAGEEVVKESDEKHFYHLSGWSRYENFYQGALPAVYEDMVFEAKFGKTLRSYNLSINYFVEDSLYDNFSQNFIYGDNYEIDSPVINGYSPNMPYVSGSITQDSVINVHYSSYSVWSGEVATSFASGDGSQASPYIINTAEQLAKLSSDVAGGNNYQGVYFKLGVNLDLNQISWTAIGKNSLPFAGIFDGNGFLVYNLNYNNTLENTVANSGHALFSTISGTVKNLSVSGSVTSVARYTAIIVGNSIGGTVENCHSYGQVIGYGNVGGVVGLCSGSVSDCTNYASVYSNGSTSAYRFGGVVGTIHLTADVQNCVNYGTVKIEKTSGNAGGVVGYREGSSTMSNCSNYGYVYSVSSYVGGVLGHAIGDATTITNCYNYAPVQGKEYVAGVLGHNTNCALTNSENFGFIKGTGSVGGVVGMTSANVSDCVNYGSAQSTGSYCAGVVSRTTASVYNCVNNGDIYGSASSMGGVVSYISGGNDVDNPNEIVNCVNYGNVTIEKAGTNNIGGVVGLVKLKAVDEGNVKPVINNCINYGDINSAASYSGGVIGSLGGGVAKNCVNYGNVYAKMGSYVAGIAGSNWNYSLVTACTNYGAILGGSSVGEICGQLTSTSTAPGNYSNGKLL